MNSLTVYLDAVGLCGPGLPNWATAGAALKGASSYTCAPAQIEASDYLPAAERRRVGIAVKLALAVAKDALKNSPFDAAHLLSVFSSSGGDGDNCHLLCEALASSDRLISPTRFTNSVHNAPSGYWGIALKATAASTSVCAFDGSFSMGLLEAATQARTAQAPVLLIAYDTPYPEPLRATRPIAHSFGVALILNHRATPAAIASLQLELVRRQATVMSDPELEALRRNVPAARSLPLLQALASGPSHTELVLDMFDNQQLMVRLACPTTADDTDPHARR
jgi:Beta-ketoacyl synthase, N-terminal domain